MEPYWWGTRDGDADLYDLFERHYSSRKNKNRKQRQFAGPGEHIVLRTIEARGIAGFVWRRDRYRLDRQHGVCCTFFRNEGEYRSSDLIRQADAVAGFVWPGERHYTFVDAEKIRSTNPGYCFLAAGWQRCGQTRKGLVILERCLWS